MMGICAPKLPAQRLYDPPLHTPRFGPRADEHDKRLLLCVLRALPMSIYCCPSCASWAFSAVSSSIIVVMALAASM